MAKEPIHTTLFGQLLLFGLFLGVLFLGLLFVLSFFIAKAPGVALAYLDHGMVWAGEFLIPSSQGNGIFGVFVLVYLALRYLPVTVRHGLEKTRCLTWGKSSNNLWYAVGWNGKYLVAASEILADYRGLPQRKESQPVTTPAVVRMSSPREMRTLYYGPMNEMNSPNSKRQYRMADTYSSKVWKMLMFEIRKTFAMRQLKELNQAVVHIQPMRAGLPPSGYRQPPSPTIATSTGGN
jgi:hypothetical protein